MRQRLLSTIGFPASVAPAPATARRVNRRPLLWALPAAAAVALGVLAGTMTGTAGHARRAIGSSSHSQVHLSTAASLAISRGLGADLAGYRLARSPGGFLARNARQGLTASFSARGATISTRGGAHVSIALQAVGSGTALHTVGLARPLAHANRAEYQRGAATEWFANGPAGVEQGFTVAAKPTGATNGALTFALGVSGTLTARPSAGGGLVLTGASGKAVLRYGDLSVTDARGRTLPAHMTAEHGRVLISVNARGARYPLTIDPLLASVGELYASDGVTEDELGDSVSASGGTVVVGDTENSSVRGDGSAYVFTEGAGGWTTATQQTKLVPSSQETEEGFGTSVAISGSTIVVGAPNHAGIGGVGAGQAYVFTEPTGGWGAKAQLAQVATLIDAEDEDTANFGVSVAISNETIVVGAPRYVDYSYHTPGRIGAAFIFQEPAGGWTNDHKPTEFQNAILIAKEDEVEALIGHFGESVAIGETEGKQTVAVGAPGEPAGTEIPGKYQRGLVFLVNRPANGWPARGEFNPQSHLSTSEVTEFSHLGQSVSISGNVIAAGATKAEVGSVKQGATYVFTAPAAGWGAEPEQTQAAKLVNPGGSELDEFGRSVAVEGDTVATAGLAKNIYLFAMPSVGWNGEQQPTAEFTAGPKPTETGIFTVALSSGDVLAGRLSASPPDEIGHQEQGAVDVVPFAPAASTRGTSGLTEVAATVEGTVNPDQTTLKECHFQYGIGSSYGQEAPCSSFPTTGAASSAVSAVLSKLSPGTTYHYRVVVSNEVDTSYGADATFTTQSSKGGPPLEEKSTGGGSTTIGTTSTSTTSTPSTSTSTPVSVASSPKAVEELLNGCSSSALVLNDVYIQGGHVAIRGSAAKSLVGKKVKILFNEGKQVATATVEANGQYTTTAPLPPAKIRDSLSTRYTAEVGKVRSVHLKLVRRLLLEPPRASGTTVTLTGQLTLPLTKPIAPIVVEQQLECGKTTVATTFTPPVSGRFHITLTVPSNARAGIFRLTSKVAANKHSIKHGFTTFSLPLPVVLG